MSDEELNAALVAYLKGHMGWPEIADLFGRCRDVLDCILFDLKGQYSARDKTLNPDYSLPTTITVGDAREAAAILRKLDAMYRKAVNP